MNYLQAKIKDQISEFSSEIESFDYQSDNSAQIPPNAIVFTLERQHLVDCEPDVSLSDISSSL